jgi:N6-L-threonylcarbamoyladenine synthase
LRILALETSCDDTCAAVVEGPRIASNVISSQAAFHERYGGVVPEVASRHHLELVNTVVSAALDEAEVRLEDLDALAVTRGPGLIGALLVGVSTAKALAASNTKPLIPVDHLQGHVAANFLEPAPLNPPFLCLIASGGHTLLAGVHDRVGFEVLGTTVDDAAGEAFDKGARLLGLGYPGGPAIERAARDGDPEAFDFPVAMGRRGLDFSFSGVKTALVYRVRDLGAAQIEAARADLAASYQRAIVDQLIAKIERALTEGAPQAKPRSHPINARRWRALALGGGVAANGELRSRATRLCSDLGLPLKKVPIELCTDNAAMIASAARFADPIPYPDYLDLDVYASGDAVRAA